MSPPTPFTVIKKKRVTHSDVHTMLIVPSNQKKTKRRKLDDSDEDELVHSDSDESEQTSGDDDDVSDHGTDLNKVDDTDDEERGSSSNLGSAANTGVVTKASSRKKLQLLKDLKFGENINSAILLQFIKSVSDFYKKKKQKNSPVEFHFYNMSKVVLIYII